MDIDGIETFLAIARFGSFTGAAQRLHRSQPAINRRRDIVEHKPGAPLFERLRAGMRTMIPIAAIHRRNGYLAAAARALLC